MRLNHAVIDLSVRTCRWIVFDAVGTLIQPTPSVAAAYHAIAARRGSRFGVDEVGDRFRKAFRQSEQTPFGSDDCTKSVYLSSDAIEIARWHWIVGEVVPDVDDRESCFAELWEHFALPSSWTCFDDVEATLSQLRSAGFRLAIASNFDSRLHRVCQGHAALFPIETRFVSSETGYRKPAPEFYAAITSQCGCAPDEILMIGDDLEHDVLGPRTAGMRSLMINRRSPRTADSLQSLRQLLEPSNPD